MPLSLSVVRVPNGSPATPAVTSAPIGVPWVSSIDVKVAARMTRLTVKHERAAGKASSARIHARDGVVGSNPFGESAG